MTVLESAVTPTHYATATKSVMTYTIADVFALTEEEIMWASYQISEALKSIQNSPVKLLPSAVKMELETNEYSKRLFSMGKNAHPSLVRKNVATIDALDWAILIADIALKAYDVRAIESSAFVGRISGILTELGVGNPLEPRASKYLTNAALYVHNLIT